MNIAKAAGATLLALLILPLASCETARQALQLQKPSVALKGLSFGEINLESATLLFDVEVGNPYSVPLPLTNMDYALTSSQRALFAGKVDSAQTIPARQKTVLTVPAKVGYLDLVMAFKDIRPGIDIPYKADTKFLMDAPVLGPIAIPALQEGHLTVSAIPNIDSIDWKSKALEALKNL